MKKLILLLISVWLAFCGCENMENIPGDGSQQGGNLNFDTRNVSQELMDNTRLFLFDGDNRNNAIGQYHGEIVGISRIADVLSANVMAGKWNIGMISCENNPLAQLKLPARGTDLKDNLMWRTEPVGEELPDTPEILYEDITAIDILPNVSNSTTATFKRHVAKVQVELADGVGFSVGGGHKVYLKNVPTSISWGRSLYPGKNNPEHSGNKKMTREFTFQDAGSGHQKSDVVNFIVPAHISTSENDTTTHKLIVGVNFKTVGGTSYEKEVVVDKVPRNNTILLIRLSAKGGVEVKTEIVDWTVESSTDNPEFYTMIDGGYNSSTKEQTFSLTMNQERSWYVRLEGANPECFEFVDGASASGQLGTTVIKIKQSIQHPGSVRSAILRLYISGVSSAVGSWNIQN